MVQVISHADEQHSLQVVLTNPSVIFLDSALQKIFSNDTQREGAKAWLASRELEGLKQEVRSRRGSLNLHLDGRTFVLQADRDFILPDGSLKIVRLAQT